jgi:hypothetical protein
MWLRPSHDSNSKHPKIYLAVLGADASRPIIMWFWAIQLRAASKRLRETNFACYKFATFFTTGLPYGLFVGNVVPCSHVMKQLDCGLSINNALIEEHAPIGLASAIVFSPELFSSEETDDLDKLLESNNSRTMAATFLTTSCTSAPTAAR